VEGTLTGVAQPWSADRLGDPDGPAVAVFIHEGFWRARYAADTVMTASCVSSGAGVISR
jgi:hypothetical protein